RLQGAIDDVASHLAPSEDLETRRLVLDVVVRRNGREPVLHELVSRERNILPRSTPPQPESASDAADSALDGGP
ncbi:MAG TPA: hypothetical protein VM580_01260, partial [Labilithrix sp.]|nr:hypothetical protein [Labilithrix sp.]